MELASLEPMCFSIISGPNITVAGLAGLSVSPIVLSIKVLSQPGAPHNDKPRDGCIFNCFNMMDRNDNDTQTIRIILYNVLSNLPMPKFVPENVFGFAPVFTINSGASFLLLLCLLFIKQCCKNNTPE